MASKGFQLFGWWVSFFISTFQHSGLRYVEGKYVPDIGNWPKKSNAIAIEILTQKSSAIVIMHYFYQKRNAIFEVIAIELVPKIGSIFLTLIFFNMRYLKQF